MTSLDAGGQTISWARTVAVAAVAAAALAGVLSGCNNPEGSPATASSTPVGGTTPATPADIDSLRQCLVGVGATTSAASSGTWRITFADGYSMAFTVPKPGQRSLQTVFLSPDDSAVQARDLQRLIACYRPAFGSPSDANGVLTPQATGNVAALGAPGSGTRRAADALIRAHGQPSLYPALAIPAIQSLRCVTKVGYLSCLGRTRDGRHMLARLTVRKDGSLAVGCVALWRGSGPVVGCMGADTRDFTR